MVAQQDLTVLVVEDEAPIRESLEIALEAQGYNVLLAQDGNSGLQLFEKKPDMILLDWMLPDISGLEVCRQIRKLSQVPILMLTARGELDDRVEGLDNGADDYLSKPFKLKELLARMRALQRRSRGGESQAEQLSYGDMVLDPSSCSVIRNGSETYLTALEFQLLSFLVRHARQVLSKEQLLNRVWGWEEGVNINVVEVHVSALRQKLDDTDRKLIRTVRGLGYVFGR